jgi:hypothetical protein
MSQLTIASKEISQDAEGRYCLNDLHRASGGERRHWPSEWFRNQQTKDLISELESDTETRYRLSRVELDAGKEHLSAKSWFTPTQCGFRQSSAYR